MGKIKDPDLLAELTAKIKARNKLNNNLWRFVYSRRKPCNQVFLPASKIKLQLKVAHVDWNVSKISREAGIDVVYFEAEPSEDACKN